MCFLLYGCSKESQIEKSINRQIREDLCITVTDKYDDQYIQHVSQYYVLLNAAQERAIKIAYLIDGETPLDYKQAVRKMDALTEAKIFTKREDRNTQKYITITYKGVDKDLPFGYNDLKLCYATKKIYQVSNYIDINKDGMEAVWVTYSYHYTDIPKWAKTSKVQKEFPEIEQVVRSNEQPVARDEIILYNTHNGWLPMLGNGHLSY